MDIYTLEQIKKLATEQGYKFCQLTGMDGAEFVPWNPSNYSGGFAKRFEDIQKRLKSPTVPDGLYIIKCKVQQKTSITPDSFTVQKGDLDSEQVTKIIVEQANPETLSESQMTITEVIELRVSNQLTTAENERLKTENEELKEKVATLEADLEEADEDTLSQGPNHIAEYLKELGPTFVPIADRYFDLEERKLELETIKELKKQGYQITAPGQQNGQQQQPQSDEVQYEDVELENVDWSQVDPSQLRPGTEEYKAYVNWFAQNHPEEYADWLAQMEQQQPEEGEPEE